MKEFDYYVFIDYSENILGYLILEKNQIKELLPKVSKFSHYRYIKSKSNYLHSIKKIIEKNDLKKHLFKLKIEKTKNTLEIYTSLEEFLKKHYKSLIFISIDDKQYSNFERLILKQ